MTNKEAIEVLEQMRSQIANDRKWLALSRAIKALEDIEEWDKLRLICANEGIFVYKVKED